MKNICVKLIQRENKKYRKMLSSEETIFPEFDPESASTSPYTPGATLQDDDWFCITNAKGQEYSIDLLSDTVSTADLDSLTRMSEWIKLIPYMMAGLSFSRMFPNQNWSRKKGCAFWRRIYI